jgi:GntR family transcriptional regulator
MSWEVGDLERGPVPLWFQVSERLRAAIARGEFVVGDALPSESVLNRRFGISRTTARAALDQLEVDGLITRGSGRGSIVLPPRVEQPLNLLASFAEDMKARGLVPGYRTLSVRATPATAEVAEALGVRRGTRVVTIDRLLLADGEPLAATRVRLSPDVLPVRSRPEPSQLDQISLYEWLETTTGHRIALGEEYIEADVADTNLAELLLIEPGAAVLIARRCSRAADRRPIEYVVNTYRADRYRFRVELVRP